MVTPLVGRRDELRRIEAALIAAMAGRGKILAIRGDPGIGKSRLVEAAAAMAVRHGLRVLHGRAVDHQRHLETDDLTPRHRRTLTRAPAACWTDLG